MKKMSVVLFLCVVGILMSGLGLAVSADQEKQVTQVAARLIDINTATVEELATLDGIGKAYAERIVAFREANGRFLTIEAVKDVKGIGERIFEKNKDRITVGQPGPR